MPALYCPSVATVRTVYRYRFFASVGVSKDKLIKLEIMRGENDDCRILRMSGDSIYEDSWR